MRERWGILSVVTGSVVPCLFCGAVGRKLTKEHVYGRWIGRAFGLHGTIDLTSTDPAGKQRVLRTRREIDDQIKQVCESCNHGWSHDLERAFRAVMLPALTGTGAVMLGRGSQQVVAVWATKLWLLAELSYSYARGGNVSGGGILRYLRATNAPPELTQVFIGALRRTDRTLTSLSHMKVVSVSGQRLGYLGVMTVGALLIHVYGPSEPEDGARLISLVSETDGLMQVWPNQVEEVRWPPPTVFTREQVARLWPGGGAITLPG